MSKSDLPAFRITWHDGSQTTTSMAKGITLEQAKAHYIGQEFVEEINGNEHILIGEEVEQIS